MAKIASTDSVDNKKTYTLLYGPPGAGKTSQILKIREAGFRPVGMNLENGFLCLHGHNIPFLDVTKDDDGNPVPREKRISRFNECMRYALTDECKRDYDTLFIDSLAEYAQLVLEAAKLDASDKADGYKAYGTLLVEMMKLLIRLRDIPHYNVVFTCLSKVDKDETGRRFTGLDLIGQTADRAPQFFDSVLYLRVNQDSTRSLICGPIDSILAKDRSGKLKTIEAPDLGAIFKKMMQK